MGRECKRCFITHWDFKVVCLIVCLFRNIKNVSACFYFVVSPHCKKALDFSLDSVALKASNLGAGTIFLLHLLTLDRDISGQGSKVLIKKKLYCCSEQTYTGRVFFLSSVKRSEKCVPCEWR